MTVAELGLGTAFMAAQGQAGVDECVARAMERGVNYIDTAANYGKGKDEEMLGTALRGRRDGVFLATKVGCVADPGGHRKVDSLMAQFEGSLRRLQTDRVDLIQLHEADQRKWWTDDAVAEVEAVSHTGPLIKDDEEYDLASAPCVEFLHRAKAQGRRLGDLGDVAHVDWRAVALLDYDVAPGAARLDGRHFFSRLFRLFGSAGTIGHPPARADLALAIGRAAHPLHCHGF